MFNFSENFNNCEKYLTRLQDFGTFCQPLPKSLKLSISLEVLSLYGLFTNMICVLLCDSLKSRSSDFMLRNMMKAYHAMLCYAKSLQSCPTLCDPIDSSPLGSPIPGILQARTLEWAYSNANPKFNSNVILCNTFWMKGVCLAYIAD